MNRKHNPTPVVIIGTQDKGNRYYPSVADASRNIGVPANRLFEALASSSGLVRWTDPPLYIDLAAQPYNVEQTDPEADDDF